jgi:copper transport protein
LYGYSAEVAGRIGLVGAILQILLFLLSLPEAAARQHVTVGQALTRGGVVMMVQIASLVLALVGFALAAWRQRAGWPLAAVAVLALTLRSAASGQWSRLVNPIHVFAGGLWIGTLFVMVVAGLGTAFRRNVPREQRGAIAAELVNAFSPLALSAAALLATFGVITAVRHLPYLSALWTTPYGLTFLVKLALVLGVASLGAWNWRRMRPSLGDEAAAVAIRRSSWRELTIAGLVLITTAVLVSLPSPRRRPAADRGPEPAPATAR